MLSAKRLTPQRPPDPPALTHTAPRARIIRQRRPSVSRSAIASPLPPPLSHRRLSATHLRRLGPQHHAARSPRAAARVPALALASSSAGTARSPVLRTTSCRKPYTAEPVTADGASTSSTVTKLSTTVGKERAGTSGSMEAEPCWERVEGDMSKYGVKKDKKKKKREKGSETEGQEQKFDAAVENLEAGRDEAKGKQSGKSKKSKRKRNDAGESSAGDQVVTVEDKRRKKEHPVSLDESNQKQTVDSTVEKLVGESDKVKGKESSKSKKSKHKRKDAGEASAGYEVATREDKKSKKEHPLVLEESSQKQALDTTAENSTTERDKVEGKQSSKRKKCKHRRNYSGEASAGYQVLAKEDTKKHTVVLEKSTQPKNTSKGESREIKERGKEGDKSSPELSKNASAGGEEAGLDGKNDTKKKKSKEGTQGTNEKEEAPRSKNKGKRVSFADSTEVFRVEGGDGEGIEGGKKKKKATQSKNKGKRVSFADSTEAFSVEGDNEEGGSIEESKLVHGLRFTPEEDAILMQAIRDFIEMKQMGEKGLEMFRTPRKHKELRRCWDVIGKSLPHRPYHAIYRRAHILLNRSDERKWTQEEKEYIRRFVEKNGTEWKKLAHELGKCDIHVKDTWRRIKSENIKKGMECATATNLTYVVRANIEIPDKIVFFGESARDFPFHFIEQEENTGYWTQDEHQKLFDLVNLDLRMKAHQIKNPTNRKLRDNISWEAISDKLTTRNHKNCCLKWYDTLASPLVRKGIWADVDDYLMVEALQKDDAVCVEDVDWDSLLDHRSGEVCRQRWNQMVRGLGGHREKPFIEQVDVLSRRYCPEMIEYRKPQE